VSLRTLRRWAARADREVRPVGRPRHPEEVRERVRVAVKEALDRLGWTAGEERVRKALPGAPRRPLREALADLKAARREEERRREEARRIRVEVLVRDALWCLDGTHLGRLRGRAVEAQVLREAATRRTLFVTVGGAATEDDVIAVLEAMEALGRLPLALGTDNGSCNIADRVVRWLAEHHVVHLLNLPRTPRHNAFVERAIGELKAESGLGSGMELKSEAEALRKLEEARTRLDELRERPCLGGRTASAVDATLPSVYTAVGREAFYNEVRAAVEVAVGGIDGARARRLAEREVVFRALERRGLIQRTRGGLPYPSPKADTITC
jgi:transposase InsO family protein